MTRTKMICAPHRPRAGRLFGSRTLKSKRLSAAFRSPWAARGSSKDVRGSTKPLATSVLSTGFGVVHEESDSLCVRACVRACVRVCAEIFCHLPHTFLKSLWPWSQQSWLSKICGLHGTFRGGWSKCHRSRGALSFCKGGLCTTLEGQFCCTQASSVTRRSRSNPSSRFLTAEVEQQTDAEENWTCSWEGLHPHVFSPHMCSLAQASAQAWLKLGACL